MADSEALSDYGVLAPHYDPIYDAELGQRAEEIAVARGVVEAFRPGVRSLLDLGTGTGAILSGFKGLVGELVGVDTSPEMLVVARDRLPEAEFVEADMSEFELGREVDAVMSLFNSINHLDGFDKWRRLFSKTEQNLSPGGVFIFDMLTPGFMDSLAANRDAHRWPFDGGKYTVIVEPDGPNRYTAGFTVELDGQDSSPQTPVTGNLYETVYPVQEVKAALDESFELLLDFDAKVGIVETGVLEPATDDSVRAMFVCRKR